VGLFLLLWDTLHNFKLILLSNVSELSNLRLHAQALTLGALAGAALVEYYDRKKEAKAS